MKVVMFVVLLAGIGYCAPFMTQEYFDEINSKQNLWTAGPVAKFSGMSREELKKYVSAKVPIKQTNLNVVDYSPLREFMDIPENFDSRQQWPNCVDSIRDQQTCGASWAFATVGAFGYRKCIATQGQTKVTLSPQNLIDCDFDDYGCDGGWPQTAWEYLRNKGVPSDQCYPYKAYGQSCTQKCTDGSGWNLYKAKDVRQYKNTDDVKTDIMANGPVETWFAVYEDFYNYNSGVYIPTSTELIGYTAVEVLGWGYWNGVYYWVAANTWGTGWGESGYFRIGAGKCQFDDIDHFVAGSA